MKVIQQIKQLKQSSYFMMNNDDERERDGDNWN